MKKQLIPPTPDVDGLTTAEMIGRVKAWCAEMAELGGDDLTPALGPDAENATAEQRRATGRALIEELRERCAAQGAP